MNTSKKIGLVLIASVALAVNALAGLQTQTDTNSLAVSSTNTFLLYGDRSGSYTNGEQSSGNSYIDGSKSANLYAEVGGFFTNATAGASNVSFQVYGTVNFHDWALATNVNVVVPASSTNWAFTQFILPGAVAGGAWPGYGLLSIKNTNSAITGAPNTQFFQAYSKNGI